MRGLVGFLLFIALVAYGLMSGSVATALACVVLACVVFARWPVEQATR